MLKMVETKTSSNNITEQTSNIYLSKEDIENIKARVITNVITTITILQQFVRRMFLLIYGVTSLKSG